MKRRSGTLSKVSGITGVLYMQADHRLNRKQHPAHGGMARIVTNRFSGVEVELTNDHGPFSAGTRFSVHSNDFLPKGSYLYGLFMSNGRG